MKLLKKIAPATIDKLNANVIKQIEIGRKILEKIGEENYDREARKKAGPKKPNMILEKKEKIIFEE